MPAAWVSAGVGLLSAFGGSKSSDSNTSSQQKLDPRLDAMLFGKDGSTGLLDQYKGYLNQAPSAALTGYGQTAGNYLDQYGQQDQLGIRNTAANLMQPDGTALTSLPAYAVGGHVDAPSQNATDLSDSYNSLINGTPGANPYLQQSIAGGIAQSTNGFNQMMSDATDNLQRNVLPGIRSNSVLTGQYGGSRQGVAEGNAIGDFSKSMASAANQFGQANTNAATNASLSAYDTDRNRQLAATQGLGAQQYGVASQNTANDMASQFLNVNNLYDATKTNAAATNQMAQVNNSAGLAGAGLLGGLTSSMYGTAQNADNAGINRATQVNGLLSPYLSANQSQTSTQPIYQNTAGNLLGGALGGLSLYNQFNKASGSGTGSTQFSGANLGSLSDLFGANSSFSSGFGS